MNNNNNNLYFAKSGNLFVMSEFLLRGWNVGTAKIDIGDETFFVQDESGTLRKVQVKTSKATRRKKSFTGKFKISLRELRNIGNVRLYYAFTIRRLDQWTKPVIIRQDYLLNYLENDKIGSVQKETLTLNFSYSERKIECSKIDLTEYVADFGDFPISAKRKAV